MGEGGVPGEPDFDAFEQDLPDLRGITHARVVHEKGRVVECHVVSDGSKDPRALKRDIEALASAKFGVEIDHKVISIAELPDVVVRPRDDRIVVVSVSVMTTGGSVACTVVVRRGNDTGEGSATGGATLSGVPNVIARAALEACSKVLGEALAVEILNAFMTPVDQYNVATVLLTFVDAEGNEFRSPGTANARGDHNVAVAEALVHAVNRHLGM